MGSLCKTFLQTTASTCGVRVQHQWLLWSSNGLDHAEAGPNCRSCSCSNLRVPSCWISSSHCLPQESDCKRKRKCKCLLLLISGSIHCCFYSTNHHHRVQADPRASSEGTVGVNRVWEEIEIPSPPSCGDARCQQWQGPKAHSFAKEPWR